MTRRRFMMQLAGGLPPEPASYVWHATYAGTNATFTAPADGWYLFHVIGKGGNGGRGGMYGYKISGGTATFYSGGGGGSGASGAYALHAVYMLAGETAKITYSTSQTTLVVQGETIIANAGGNGGDGPQTITNNTGTPGSAGSAKTASGANRLNISGKAGQRGGYGSSSDPYGTRGVGASTSNPPYPTGSKYMNGTSKAQGSYPTSVTTGSGTILGNPGPGGQGGFSSTDGNITGSGYGGTTGAAGGVVVEKGAA